MGNVDMAGEVFFLNLLSAVMFFGSYLCGNIPLVMKLSEAKLKLITIFGAGLLVGTALAVIIPEGINSLYTNVKFEESFNENEKSQINSIQYSCIVSNRENLKLIGISLILGFIFMMLIDQISQRRNSSKKITATVGLVVHAAVDGVALGAAATTNHQDVELIVFLAIMLHKAPSAFGLVSFLMHEKFDVPKIRQHLIIFSLSAPALALVTYFGIGQEEKEAMHSLHVTGIAMLFSAGTFLYVATVHVLPELTQFNADHTHSQYEYLILEADSNITKRTAYQHGLRIIELFLFILGSFLPWLTTLGHNH